MTWSSILWSVLDTSVLAMTIVYKMPQLYEVLSTSSSAGISMASLVLEFTSYSIEMTYQIAMKYPVQTYFEMCLMWSQDVILLLVVLEERQLLGRQLIAPLAIYLVCFASIVNYWLPDIVMYTLIMSTTPVLGTSKSAQLWKIVRSGDPGRVSALTWGMLTYMAAGDLALFFNCTMSTILDLAITISVVYFNSQKENP